MPYNIICVGFKNEWNSKKPKVFQTIFMIVLNFFANLLPNEVKQSNA